MTYVISYDITSPKKLTKTAKYLERIGVRIQKSIFVVQANQHRIKTIRSELEQITGPEGDILVIPVCNACNNRVKRLGPENELFVVS